MTSRVEDILESLINGTSYDKLPKSRVEAILIAFLGSPYDKNPLSRVEELLLALKDGGLYSDGVLSRVEAILNSKLTGEEYTDEPKSRIEELLLEWDASGNPNLVNMDPEYIAIGKYINDRGAELKSSNNFYNSYYIPVSPDTEYVAEINPAVSYFSIMEYDGNKKFIWRTLWGASQPAVSNVHFTVTGDTHYILFGSNINSSVVDLDMVLSIDWTIKKA